MRKTTSWAAIVLALCTGVGAFESPAELLALKMKTQLLTQTEGTMTWEGVCWHASRRAGDFVGAAGQSGDLAYDESIIVDVHIGDVVSVDATGGIDGVEGLTILEWMAEVEPGDYRIRWAFTTGAHIEHRDYPIEVE